MFLLLKHIFVQNKNGFLSISWKKEGLRSPTIRGLNLERVVGNHSKDYPIQYR